MVARILLGLWLMLASGQTGAAQIWINEVHPTPPAGEPEWVEVWNVGSSSVDLSGWYVCDARTCVRLHDVRLPGGAYAVVTRDGEALRETRSLRDDVVVIEAQLPSLNNSTDAVVLRRSDSAIVDSISYRVVIKGRSLERDADGAWDPSLARDSATCGMLNARWVLRHDLRAAAIVAGGPVPRLDVMVENRGRSTTASTVVTLATDMIAVRSVVPPLDPKEMWIWSVDLADVGSTPVLQCTAYVDANDDRAANDTITATMLRPPPSGTVSITEVMVQPDDAQCDYVEVFNGSDDTVDLDGWMLVDGSRDTVRVAGHVTMSPGVYAVIATDTIVRRMMHPSDRERVALVKRSFNIDTDGDELKLLNPSGFVVDNASIDPARHVDVLPDRRGVALEKMHPQLMGTESSSWTSSGDLTGGTPGRANSWKAELPQTSAGLIEASMDRPRILRFRQPFRHAAIYVRVFTPEGVHVQTLLDNVIAGTDGAVLWDERTDNGMPVPRGPYVAVLDAYDASSDRVVHAVGVVVAGD